MGIDCRKILGVDEPGREFANAMLYGQTQGIVSDQWHSAMLGRDNDVSDLRTREGARGKSGFLTLRNGSVSGNPD